MKLERFPLDEQECPIQIQSCKRTPRDPLGVKAPRIPVSDAYVEQMVNLTWHVNVPAGYPIGRNLKIKLNNMNITGTNATYCTEPYPMMRGWGKSGDDP